MEQYIRETKRRIMNVCTCLITRGDGENETAKKNQHSVKLTYERA